MFAPGLLSVELLPAGERDDHQDDQEHTKEDLAHHQSHPASRYRGYGAGSAASNEPNWRAQTLQARTLAVSSSSSSSRPASRASISAPRTVWADLDNTIRQLGELGLLGRPASQETLEKLTTALNEAHTVRARLGDGGESKVIGPDDIDRLREPAKRLAAWRRLITDTVESVTVAPAMTSDGRPSRLWNPRRIDVRFLGPHP